MVLLTFVWVKPTTDEAADGNFTQKDVTVEISCRTFPTIAPHREQFGCSPFLLYRALLLTALFPALDNYMTGHIRIIVILKGIIMTN